MMAKLCFSTSLLVFRTIWHFGVRKEDSFVKIVTKNILEDLMTSQFRYSMSQVFTDSIKINRPGYKIRMHNKIFLEKLLYRVTLK